jgi:exodeoxyribonuclease VII small subunit
MKKESPNPRMPFEKAMEQLEAIVQELESGALSLDDALKKFEEGIKLSKYCSARLDETEKKIALLMEKANGTLAEAPFPENEE